jgi:DNA-binding MarR family transcriptional regulator
VQQTEVTPQQLAEQLVSFLNTAMKYAQGDLFAVIEKLGVSLSQFKIMHLLDVADGERTPSELARTIGLSPAATGRAADALARQGLLLRRDDELDRRVKWLSLTDKGREALEHITAARNDAVARLAENLDPDQRAALCEALGPLLASAPDPTGP